MRISIIINNYNYGSFLRGSIESALSQTYSDVEVIVVDDGSTDNSRDVISYFGAQVTTILKQNGGQGSAVNAGFGASTGDVVIFLDADDELLPRCSETVVRVWRPEFSKVHFNLEFITAEGVRLRRPYSDKALARGDLKALTLATGTVDSMPMSGNAFSRQFLNNVMPMAESDWARAADVYLFNLAVLEGEIGAIDEILGLYRMHGDNHSAMIRAGKVNIAGLEDFVVREYRTDRAISAYATKRGLDYRVGTLTSTTAHLQQAFLLQQLARKRANLIGTPRTSVLHLVSAIFRSEIGLAKKMIISAWCALVALAPQSMKAAISIFGYKHGLVLAVSKTVARSHSSS